MQIRISTKEGIPIYRQIISQIKYIIASGHLSPGDKLTPVRRLAEQLMINPNTVARAYRELETLGILVAHQGSGVWVSNCDSPLAREQQRKILIERIYVLLVEARLMNIDGKEITDLIHECSSHLQSQGSTL